MSNMSELHLEIQESLLWALNDEHDGVIDWPALGDALIDTQQRVDANCLRRWGVELVDRPGESIVVEVLRDMIAETFETAKLLHDGGTNSE